MSSLRKEGMLHRFLKPGHLRRCLRLEGLDNCSPSLFDGSDWTSQGELIFYSASISALSKEESTLGYSQSGVILKVYQCRLARKLREKKQPESTISSMTDIRNGRKRLSRVDHHKRALHPPTQCSQDASRYLLGAAVIPARHEKDCGRQRRRWSR